MKNVMEMYSSSSFLGIDTSNYTTSVALFTPSESKIVQQKMILPVKQGDIGMRQSDAVFHHVVQLPKVTKMLFEKQKKCTIAGVSASNKPSSQLNSYMPCFLVGEGSARQIASVNRLPAYFFTHQQGHVAAACFGAGKLDILKEKHIAFHVSGGTTEALIVCPHETEIISVNVVSKSLDLKAGQLIDRVGVMLGLPFPAGAHLEKMALTAEKIGMPKASMVGENCSLSGVQNRCEKKFRDGNEKSEIALFCIMSVASAVLAMLGEIFKVFGDLPLVFAGGVMSSVIIKAEIQSRYDAHFAPPEFASDNAAGTAVLGFIKQMGFLK